MVHFEKKKCRNGIAAFKKVAERCSGAFRLSLSTGCVTYSDVIANQPKCARMFVVRAVYRPEFPHYADSCATVPGSRTSCRHRRETCSPGTPSPRRSTRTLGLPTALPENSLDVQHTTVKQLIVSSPHFQLREKYNLLLGSLFRK